MTRNVRGEKFKELAGALSGCIDRQRAQGRTAFELAAQSIPGIIWKADVHGKVHFFSDTFTEITGKLTPDEWVDCIHPDEVQDVVAHWLACVKSGIPYSRRIRLRADCGKYLEMVSWAEPTRHPDGSIAFWVGHTSRHVAQTRNVA